MLNSFTSSLTKFYTAYFLVFLSSFSFMQFKVYNLIYSFFNKCCFNYFFSCLIMSNPFLREQPDAKSRNSIQTMWKDMSTKKCNKCLQNLCKDFSNMQHSTTENCAKTYKPKYNVNENNNDSCSCIRT